MQIQQLDPKSLVVVDEVAGRVDPKSQSLQELAESIKAHGVLQPIIADEDSDKLIVIAGRRRRAAAILAGLEDVPVIVVDVDHQKAAEITVIENLQREDLSPLEEASGVHKLLDVGWKVEDVAAHIGKSPAWVVRRDSLTGLTDAWKQIIADPKHKASGWPASWLEIVARMPEEHQEELLKSHRMRGGYDSIRRREDLENWSNERAQKLTKARWKLGDDTLVPEAGACDTCPKRSSHRPGLFDDWGLEPKQMKRTDRCLDPACWKKKTQAYVERKRTELTERNKGNFILVHDGYGQDKPKGAIPTYDVENCKKTDKGAKPVLIANGPKAGQVYYGKLQSWVKERSSAAARPKGPDGKPKPASLKERMQKLQKRREALVNEMLHDRLEKLDVDQVASWYHARDKNDTILLTLLARFGTFPAESNWELRDRQQKAKWPEVSGNIDIARHQLWDELRKVWLSRLNYHEEPPAKEHDDLCKFLMMVPPLKSMMNIAEIREDASAKLPEPKSWANLNADGTPKKAKASGDKKTPATKKATKKRRKKKS